LAGHGCPLKFDTRPSACIVDATSLSNEMGNKMQTAPSRVVGPRDGKAGFLGSIGVRFMLDGEAAGGGFALVEHPMSPHALAAPLHRHSREDEYSYVLEGRMGALLGEDVLEAGPGDLVLKPRGEWHTFWNAGDEPCRILEIIAPAGFERFFAELVDLGGVTQADPATLGELCERYALEMDPSSVPGLIERFGVRFPGDALTD
jgi:mannose-6-phosphate isomerase-like protein (cupin superfamily)